MWVTGVMECADLGTNMKLVTSHALCIIRRADVVQAGPLGGECNLETPSDIDDDKSTS